MKLEFVYVGFPGLRAWCVVLCAFKVLGLKPLFTKRPKRARAQSLPLLSDPSIELRPTRLTNLTDCALEIRHEPNCPIILWPIHPTISHSVCSPIRILTASVGPASLAIDRLVPIW